MWDTMKNGMRGMLLAGLGAIVALPALAEGVVGGPKPWEVWLQPARSPVMERISAFHDLLVWIMAVIVLVVLGILAYVIVRFNRTRNPVPSRTSHNTLLEIVWTAVPVAILLVIVIPSVKLLYFAGNTPPHDMTIKVVGHQWYWTYTYPDHGGFSFDSLPVQDADLKEGQPRLLAVDNPVVVPVGATVQVLTTADDVIHAWAVPSLGLKKDATPGRTNETWFKATEVGVYYGQCSELCGVNHYFMPIQINAVTREAFDAWVAEAQQKFAKTDNPGTRVAAGGAQVD